MTNQLLPYRATCIVAARAVVSPDLAVILTRVYTAQGTVQVTTVRCSTPCHRTLAEGATQTLTPSKTLPKVPYPTYKYLQPLAPQFPCHPTRLFEGKVSSKTVVPSRCISRTEDNISGKTLRVETSSLVALRRGRHDVLAFCCNNVGQCHRATSSATRWI